MGHASRDENFVPTLIGVSSADLKTPIAAAVDPTTHRLLVDISGGLSFADAETPSGAINNANVIFNLANTPTPAASLILTYQGQVQYPVGVDYTLSGATITMNLAPQAGTNLVAWYRY